MTLQDKTWAAMKKAIRQVVEQHKKFIHAEFNLLKGLYKEFVEYGGFSEY